VATKKQKRQEMHDRREQFESDMRESGLRAQRKDREYRERKATRAEEEKHRETRRKATVQAASKMKKTEKVEQDG
jgi:hypothetical protein